MQGYIAHSVIIFLAIIGCASSLPVPQADPEQNTAPSTNNVPTSTSDEIVEAYNQILEVIEHHFPELSTHTSHDSRSIQSEDSFEREIRRFQRIGRRKREAVGDEKLNEILAKLTEEERKRGLSSQHSFGPGHGEQFKRGQDPIDISNTLDSNVKKDPTPRDSSSAHSSSETLAQLVKQIEKLTDKLDKISNKLDHRDTTTGLLLTTTAVGHSTTFINPEAADNSQGFDEEGLDNSHSLGHDNVLEELSQQLLKHSSQAEDSILKPEVDETHFASQQDLESLAHLFYDSVQVNKVAYERLSTQILNLKSKLIK